MARLERERISIRCPVDSLDERFIKYLKLNPFNFLYRDFSDLVFSTLKKHWFPFFLVKEGVTREELRQIGILICAELEAQVAAIREICGLVSVVSPVCDTPTSTVPTNKLERYSKPSSQNNSISLESKGEDDDDFLQLQMTNEMLEANKPFGVDLHQ